MPKLTLILVAIAFALTGALTAAQAQSKTKAKGKDRATCTKLVEATPGMERDYSGPAVRKWRSAAVARCMRGQPI